MTKLKTQKDIYNTEPYTNATEFMKAERKQAIKQVKIWLSNLEGADAKLDTIDYRGCVWNVTHDDTTPFENKLISCISLFVRFFNITEEDLQEKVDTSDWDNTHPTAETSNIIEEDKKRVQMGKLNKKVYEILEFRLFESKNDALIRTTAQIKDEEIWNHKNNYNILEKLINEIKKIIKSKSNFYSEILADVKKYRQKTAKEIIKLLEMCLETLENRFKRIPSEDGKLRCQGAIWELSDLIKVIKVTYIKKDDWGFKMIYWFEDLKLRLMEIYLRLRDGETMRMPHKSHKKEWCNLCCNNTDFDRCWSSGSESWEWFCMGCGMREGKLFTNKERVKHIRYLIKHRKKHVKKGRITLEENNKWLEELKKHYQFYIDFEKEIAGVKDEKC